MLEFPSFERLRPEPDEGGRKSSLGGIFKVCKISGADMNAGLQLSLQYFPFFYFFFFVPLLL